MTELRYTFLTASKAAKRLPLSQDCDRENSMLLLAVDMRSRSHRHKRLPSTVAGEHGFLEWDCGELR